ncbi:MAG: 4-(cytidine 5'-diphospho)-2-C-methyl-D-erythritol kinase [Peptococcaceae bacterium]|jgi:4-diphosphocytidyl-2-C-methyl-D-erythritol kinase|nr:4-(cytidine 5'-diphospho)-2-C-methyl-D-erythritol kinase [Peptococcaceae bacterium]
MKKIILKAFGKINLTLDVQDRRPDGYHRLSTVFRGIHLFDLISLEKKEEGLTLEADRKDLPQGPGNLAYDAALLMMEKFPQISGVHIRIIKKIPVMAGLAGGSADAAAALTGLNLLYELGLSRETLEAFASELGSDVAFCLYPLAALGEGRGEILTPVDPGPMLWMVLAKPSFALSTAEIYLHYDQMNAALATHPNARNMILGLENQDLGEIYRAMGNALEYPVFKIYPYLAQWGRDFRRMGAEAVLMAGSGPTLAAFAREEEQARMLASHMKRAEGWTVLLTRSLTEEDLNRSMIYLGEASVEENPIEDIEGEE